MFKTEQYMRETTPDMLRNGWIKVADATYQPLAWFADKHDKNVAEGQERIDYYLELVKEGERRGGDDPLQP